jgi:uncharacterized damage-inducible protein DinB
MTQPDAKADLVRYLQVVREAVVWKLDGLSEYDLRRPMTPTGTNLLGLVKHLASVESGYFGDTFDRPFPEPPAWSDDDPSSDLWASADETSEGILDFYRRVWNYADETIATLALDDVGHVPWWPAERNEITLHRVLVHVIAETNRHAGHMDILRETIDGAAGLRAGNDNLWQPEGGWAAYRERLEQVARKA